MDIETAEKTKNLIEQYKHDDVILTSYFKDNASALIKGTVTPLKLDNRQYCSMTDCQGKVPACVGYTVAQYLETLSWKECGELRNLDALQIYSKCKEIDKQYGSGGTFIDLGLRVGLKLMPRDFRKKYPKVMVLAKENIDDEKIKRVVHKEGFACCGMLVTEDWYDATYKNYRIKGDGEVIGGHALLICGYSQEGVLVQNHWGMKWGAKGFALVPWDVFLNGAVCVCWLQTLL